MSKKREYDEEYKVQEVKFDKNLGSAKAAAEELQIPVNMLYGWIQKVKTAELDIGCGERSPEEALSIAKENQQLKKRIKALEKENRRLSEMNLRLSETQKEAVEVSAAGRCDAEDPCCGRRKHKLWQNPHVSGTSISKRNRRAWGGHHSQ